MHINDSLYLNSPLAIGIGSTASGSSVAGTQFDPGGVVLADAYSRAAELGNALTELDRLISTAQPRKSRAAWVGSAASLNLGVGALTATTLRSTEEINATPTSFTPFGPDYDLPSSSFAPPTLDGIYDGSNGSGTITFEARRNGVHGEDNLRFRVRDPGGTIIDDIRVRASHAIDREYTLSNGLIFTLGDGYVKRNDTFTVEVFADVGSVVNPAKSFDGQRNDKPNLQYGLSVTDGSFDINGVTIAVNANDSINDVLARVTASSADVTAVFDVATETILLSRATPGPAYDITVDNDTSGFLQATKLDLAVSELGTAASGNTPINEIPQFASVTSGILQVNYVDIALDINVDSLDDILARIAASDALVLATLNNNRVYFQSSHRENAMTLDDGGTGLFAALNIESGRYKPIARDGVTLDTANEIAAATVEVKSAVNHLLNGVSGSGQIPAQVSGLGAQVQNILQAAESTLSGEFGGSLGLGIDLAGATQASGIEVDISALVSSLRNIFTDVKGVLLGETTDAKQGFVRQLLDVVNQFTADLRHQFGTSGFLVGLSA